MNETKAKKIFKYSQEFLICRHNVSTRFVGFTVQRCKYDCANNFYVFTKIRSNNVKKKVKGIIDCCVAIHNPHFRTIIKSYFSIQIMYRKEEEKVFFK